MKKRLSVIYLLIFLLLQGACYAQKRNKKNEEKLTEKQRYEATDLFSKAIIQKELGKTTNALDLLNESLAINPGDPAALYEKARILFYVGRKDEAMNVAREAVTLDPANKWYKVFYANMAKANEMYREYISIYEDLVEQYPSDFNFLNELAYGYNYTAEYKKSIDVYDKLEEITGINEPLINQKVQLYDKIGDKDAAVKEYEKLIELNPGEPRYYALLAEYCSRNNMNEKAIEAYEKIVELSPNDPYVHISLADYYKKNGDSQKAFEELKTGLANPDLQLDTKINILIAYYTGNLDTEQKKQALELSQILKRTHPEEVLAETFYASMLYENEEYSEARDILKRVLEDNVQKYVIWEQLLFCDLYLEDYTNLLTDSEEAIDYFPNYPLPYLFAGISSFQLKDYVKAKAYLESGKDYVVNNNALLEQFYNSLGDTYNELGEHEASYVAYDKVLAMNPKNALVLNNYAYYLSLRSEQLEKAEKMAKLAVEIDPYNQNNLDTYAWVLYKLNKYEEALGWIKKAYNNGGEESGVVLEHYGDILYQLNKKDEALEYWKRALNKDDYSELLQKKVNDKKLYE
ncbi:MAG: tetratricopeptide repeat protein [Bacteroidetes bacterium]|nr:tetratricopeptide repeat protein [Bacteroidota bacterium]